MKQTITLTLVLATSVSAHESKMLFNLRNHHLLKKESDSQIKPAEALALVKTFDEIPVFGGAEFREKLLEQQSKTA